MYQLSLRVSDSPFSLPKKNSLNLTALTKESCSYKDTLAIFAFRLRTNSIVPDLLDSRGAQPCAVKITTYLCPEDDLERLALTNADPFSIKLGKYNEFPSLLDDSDFYIFANTSKSSLLAWLEDWNGRGMGSIRDYADRLLKKFLSRYLSSIYDLLSIDFDEQVLARDTAHVFDGLMSEPVVKVVYSRMIDEFFCWLEEYDVPKNIRNIL